MQCPECFSAKTFVYDSRKSGVTIRRRRQCGVCSHRFSTIEVLIPLGKDMREKRKQRTLEKIQTLLNEL